MENKTIEKQFRSLKDLKVKHQLAASARDYISQVFSSK